MGLKEIDVDVYKEILSKKLKKEDYELLEEELKYSKDIQGFHGEHGSLHLQCKIGNKFQTFKFFFKGTLQREELFKKYFSKMRYFEREHYLQSFVLKHLEAAVGRKLTAECYYSRLNKFMVCEDLSEKGFERMRIKHPDEAHAKLALQAQAALHAASFVHEEKTGKSVIENFPEMDSEVVFNPRNVLAQTIRTMLSHLISKESLKIVEYQRKAFLDWFEFVLSSGVLASRNIRNAVLHGDTMVFNYLYHYDSEGKPLEAILVDFQFSRISPPTVDVVMLMATQMTLEQETSMFDKLTDFYYETLSRYLIGDNLDPNKILPERIFRESLTDLKPFSACIRLIYCLFTCIPPERLHKVLSSPEQTYRFFGVGDTELFDESYSESEEYRSSINDAFELVRKHFELSSSSKCN